METGFMNRIIGLVLALVVGGLLVGGLLIPSIEAMTATEKTLTNEGYVRYTSINADDEEEIVIQWDYTNPKYLTINDKSLDISQYKEMWASIVFGEQWTLRYNYTTTNTQLQYFGQTNTDFVYAYESSELNLTATLNSGTITVTNGTITKTATYTTAYYPDEAGSMIMKKSDGTSYLLKDSSIVIANGMTYSNPYTIGVFFDGSIGAGLNFELFRNLDDFAVSNVATHYTDSAKYEGVIELSNVTFDLTPGENPAIAATYSYFLVPYQITAELSQHMDATQIAMFGVISILGIVALVVVAANGIRNKY